MNGERKQEQLASLGRHAPALGKLFNRVKEVTLPITFVDREEAGIPGIAGLACPNLERNQGLDLGIVRKNLQRGFSRASESEHSLEAKEISIILSNIELEPVFEIMNEVQSQCFSLRLETIRNAMNTQLYI